MPRAKRQSGTEGMDEFKRVALPPHLTEFALHLKKVVDHVCRACKGLEQSVDDPRGSWGLSALGHQIGHRSVVSDRADASPRRSFFH
ncbi:MAG: hypothetical protein Ct9H300mP8_13270 [Gammaproteobacteria bacterium]|nr:MAG: hypothetical protein Ct9H300mP8_13270 [Gammaproteobacteria bacterium]